MNNLHVAPPGPRPTYYPNALAGRVADYGRQVHELVDNQVRLVSPGIVAFSGSLRAAMVCDPNGHVQLLENSDDVQ